MPTFVDFSETGDCISLSTSPGQVELPAGMTGVFPKRYKLVDGEVIDQYSGKTDEEAEQLWLSSLPPAADPVQAE